MDTKGAVIVAAVAGLFATVPVLASAQQSQQPSPSQPGTVKCQGVNSCKGQGACKSATNSCQGKNGCKGQGSVEMTAKECQEKGGTIQPQPPKEPSPPKTP
jgi:hypothetical protein